RAQVCCIEPVQYPLQLRTWGPEYYEPPTLDQLRKPFAIDVHEGAQVRYGGSRVRIPLIDIHDRTVCAHKPFVDQDTMLVLCGLHHGACQGPKVIELARLDHQLDLPGNCTAHVLRSSG